ncbi:hypothetical protein BDV38DRAFT_276335 [Aspergillus pseudotamarii]|uniref:Uncharacterized protein n=1 Tax=Aspergillus pseudotamarii TaxID=132259 RepID=A0A5N6SAV8_ASPPS|nr:uncharacterized protein BDV38DRAFT_276335 [Aspergillus pseudotamarii]KAE8130989.1 hypothetical protein BDV38DRAFT_276335 [Aspergillus pseudotamarii]
MDSWDLLEKNYYAEVNLLRCGKRIMDYDTQRDREDLEKTQRNASKAIQYIKQGILNVSVTERCRHEKYTAPSYIFSKKIPGLTKPTQEAAREEMLKYLEGLFRGESTPDTKQKPQAELRILGRPQTEDGHTFVSHQCVSDTSDDWFDKEVCDWVNSGR